MAETENNQWAKGASHAKYTVRHYGRNYSVITEQFECGRLRFYATIESLRSQPFYGNGTETERELFYEYSFFSPLPGQHSPKMLSLLSNFSIFPFNVHHFLFIVMVSSLKDRYISLVNHFLYSPRATLFPCLKKVAGPMKVKENVETERLVEGIT